MGPGAAGDLAGWSMVAAMHGDMLPTTNCSTRVKAIEKKGEIGQRRQKGWSREGQGFWPWRR